MLFEKHDPTMSEPLQSGSLLFQRSQVSPFRPSYSMARTPPGAERQLEFSRRIAQKQEIASAKDVPSG